MMKFNLTLGLLFLSFIHVFASTNFDANAIEQDEYAINKDYLHMTIPVDFGKAFLLSDAQLQTLDINQIYQIDLVYTAFKSSDEFDQEALNKSRVLALKNKIKNIDRDAPRWNLIAQTKAKDVATARVFFHGFVIYYRPKATDYTTLKNNFAPYRSELTKTYTVDNETGSSFIHPSGTTVKIPANAVTYENGAAVKGTYAINYTEYRNPAEIALSGINMTYRTANENHNFSSIGMYEIRGEKDGTSLRLQKPVKVDFNCTAIVADAAFYELDDNTNEWELIRPIDEKEFGNENVPQIEPIKEEVAEAGNIAFQEDFNSGWNSTTQGDLEFHINRSALFEEDCEVSLSKSAWNSFEKIRGKANIDTLCQRIDLEKKLIYTKEGYLETLQASIFRGKYQWVDSDHEGGLEMAFMDINIVDEGNRTNGTLLAAGMDKGHTYPKLVAGLNSESFGVYNCDQIYRMRNLTTIHPTYVDAQTGKQITQTDVLCLMDLDFNGSFSFDPNYVTLNPKGKNAMLLFTDKKEVYLMLPEAFQHVDLDENKPIIKLKNVTAELKSSKDLEEMLRL